MTASGLARTNADTASQSERWFGRWRQILRQPSCQLASAASGNTIEENMGDTLSVPSCFLSFALFKIKHVLIHVPINWSHHHYWAAVVLVYHQLGRPDKAWQLQNHPPFEATVAQPSRK